MYMIIIFVNQIYNYVCMYVIMFNAHTITHMHIYIYICTYVRMYVASSV